MTRNDWLDMACAVMTGIVVGTIGLCAVLGHYAR